MANTGGTAVPTPPDTSAGLASPASAVGRFPEVRGATEALCSPLAVEDHVVQSMPDASPAKWHLAHTTWFFETFLLAAVRRGYRSPFPQYDFLFNSYYNAVGERHERSRRGLLSRPTVAEVYEYRRRIDAEVLAAIEAGLPPDAAAVLEIGLHHEQQHQELILTDLKHMLAANPLRPGYAERIAAFPSAAVPPARWIRHEPGVRRIGHDGAGFAFDNEGPAHRVFLEAFEIADRPVTNGEYLEFLRDGGYRRPELWLSAGWNTVRSEGWSAPLYWETDGGATWRHFTLAGMREIDPAEPVCHVSLYEADAFARWAGARLPTEAEWEVAAGPADPSEGDFVESGRFHPAPLNAGGAAWFGGVWEWTRSQYSPYPGYAPAAGALGEYNGKFMCNQFVLRGGSCATPRSHIRRTYRNFFPPEARWQFSGLRLARDA
jgi:ergothioneine biosynthesis protein EgtB